MKRSPTLTCVLLSFLALSLPAYALNEAPRNRSGVRFEPCEFQVGELGGSFRSVAEDNHRYELSAHTVWQPNPPGAPNMLLSEFLDEISYDIHGLVFVGTHGGERGFIAELYDSESTWDEAFQTYLNSGFRFWYSGGPEGDIFMRDVQSGGVTYYGIAVRPNTIRDNFAEGCNTLVYVAACSSHVYADTAWQNARCALGYDYEVSVPTALSEATTFWSRLNGDSGKLFRRADYARQGLTMLLWGNGKTVLSPVVLSVSPPAGSTIDGPTAGQNLSGTKMAGDSEGRGRRPARFGGKATSRAMSPEAV